MWIIYAILSSVCASVMTILMKFGLKNIDANLATTIRTCIVVVICIAFILINGKYKEINTITSRTWLFLILAGVATFFTWIFYFLALKNGQTAKVLAIDRISIILTILLSVLFLKEKITLKMIIGCIILLIGTILVVSK